MRLKPIPNFEGYAAGDDGEIYSCWPRGRQVGFGAWRKLKSNVQTSGKYFYVSLKCGDSVSTQRVHKLVCIAFHGVPLENLTVSHLDGDWRNNSPHNLKWETYSDNLYRRKEHGTDDAGIKNSRALIDLDTLNQIRYYLNSGVLTHREIGEKFGVSRVFITKIANGYRYRGQGENNV